MLDVGGDDQFEPGQPVPGGGQTAERVDQSPPAVGAAAAAQAHDDAARPSRHRGVDQLSHPGGVRGERTLHGGWSAQQRQPAGRGAFDVGGGVGLIEHPRGVDLLLERAGHPTLAQSAEPTGQHVDEAWAAVGLRGQPQLVAGTTASPPFGDRLGGLDRGQSVAEAVRRDEHPQGRGLLRNHCASVERVFGGCMTRCDAHRSNLAGVKLLGRKNGGASEGGADPADDGADSAAAATAAEQKAAQARSRRPRAARHRSATTVVVAARWRPRR